MQGFKDYCLLVHATIKIRIKYPKDKTSTSFSWCIFIHPFWLRLKSSLFPSFSAELNLIENFVTIRFIAINSESVSKMLTLKPILFSSYSFF